jgi:hypothetical protein
MQSKNTSVYLVSVRLLCYLSFHRRSLPLSFLLPLQRADFLSQTLSAEEATHWLSIPPSLVPRIMRK